MRDAAASGKKLLWPPHSGEGGREGWRGSMATAWHWCGVSRGAAMGFEVPVGLAAGLPTSWGWGVLQPP